MDITATWCFLTEVLLQSAVYQSNIELPFQFPMSSSSRNFFSFLSTNSSLLVRMVLLGVAGGCLRQRREEEDPSQNSQSFSWAHAHQPMPEWCSVDKIISNSLSFVTVLVACCLTSLWLWLRHGPPCVLLGLDLLFCQTATCFGWVVDCWCVKKAGWGAWIPFGILDPWSDIRRHTSSGSMDPMIPSSTTKSQI